MTNIRKIVIDDSYKECESKGGLLKLTGHFIERLNLRSVNQNNTFLFFAKCLNHLLKNWEKNFGKYVEYKTFGETIVFHVRDLADVKYQQDKKFQIVAVTYYHDSTKVGATKTRGSSDVIYRLGE